MPVPTLAPAIDRLAPTLRPSGRSSMRHRWAHLLFLHWPVPADQIQGLLPDGLEVDTFDGQAYIGLVPFTMTGVRPTWSPPVWGLSAFHEVNVRTYVHHRGRDPGVWFFSLDAANPIAVRVARRFWNLNYYFARMSLKRTDPCGSIIYESERLWPAPTPADCRVEYRPTGSPAPAGPGTLEHFLVERYILYAQGRRRLLSGRVHHSPYPLQSAEVRGLDESLLAAAGVERPDSAPLAHYAEEVRVRVYPLRPA